MKKTKIHFQSALLGSVAGAILLFSVGAATGVSRPTSWEYKIVPGRVFQGELEKDINNAVMEGWEFVSVSGMSTEQHAFAVMRRLKK